MLPYAFNLCAEILASIVRFVHFSGSVANGSAVSEAS